MYYVGTETRYLAIDKNGGMYATEDKSFMKHQSVQARHL